MLDEQMNGPETRDLDFLWLELEVTDLIKSDIFPNPKDVAFIHNILRAIHPLEVVCSCSAWKDDDTADGVVYNSIRRRMTGPELQDYLTAIKNEIKR